jgi:hypothetical protein
MTLRYSVMFTTSSVPTLLNVVLGAVLAKLQRRELPP